MKKKVEVILYNSIKQDLSKEIDKSFKNAKKYDYEITNYNNDINLNEHLIYNDNDYIIMIDSNYSFKDLNIKSFLEELDDGYDLVIGTNNKGNRLIKGYANKLFHRNINDYNARIRAFKRETILKCNLNNEAYDFNPSMILKGINKHLYIKEINVDYNNENHKSNTLKDIHLINYYKIDDSIILRYAFCMFVSLFIIGLFLLGNKFLDDNRINNNIDKTISNIVNEKMVDKASDIKFMNNIKETSSKSNRNLLADNHNNDKNILLWNGNIYLSRLIFYITPINFSFYVISLIILSIMIVINSYKLFKISKLISISYMLVSIFQIIGLGLSLNMIITMFILLLLTRIMINICSRNNVNFGMYSAINGALSAFLATSLFGMSFIIYPIFILIVYNYKRNVFNTRKKLYSYILIWLIYYVFIMLIKYALYFIFIDNSIFINTLKYLYDTFSIKGILIRIIKSNYYSFNSLYPLSLIKYSGIYLFILFMIISFISKRHYKGLAFIELLIMLPIIRNIILYDYSYNNTMLYNLDFYIIILYLIIIISNIIFNYLKIRKVKRIIYK